MTNISFAIPGLPLDAHSSEGLRTRRIIQKCAEKVGGAKVKTRDRVIVFCIEDAFEMQSSKIANALALSELLKCLCNLNLVYLKLHPNTPGLYDSGVRYCRTLVWDSIPALFSRQLGDCKSLSAARIAELRNRGVWCRPVFRFNQRPGFTMFHILIMFQDGSWECPSAILGMHDWDAHPHNRLMQDDLAKLNRWGACGFGGEK